jgi:hypothetical protein
MSMAAPRRTYHRDRNHCAENSHPSVADAPRGTKRYKKWLFAMLGSWPFVFKGVSVVTRFTQPSAGFEIHAKDSRHHLDDRHDREHRPGRPLRQDVIAMPAGPEVQRRLGA